MALAFAVVLTACIACEERGGSPFGFPFAHKPVSAAVASGNAPAPVVAPLGPDDSTPKIRPKLIYRHAPDYPPRALRDGVEGWVTLKFQLTPEGVPFNQAVHQSSDRVFDDPSLRAVIKCRYEAAPAGSNLYGGRWFYVRYRFLLEGSPLPPGGQLPDGTDATPPPAT